jgi:LPS-assembly lipoprotein
MRVAVALLGAVLLGGCQLQPLYGGGVNGPVQSTLAAVQVAPIDDHIAGLGVKRDDSVTRERRTLRARYQLIEIATGTVVLDATAGSDAGIDVVGSEYATIAAERSALERLSQIVADQIVARVARFAQSQAAR